MAYQKEKYDADRVVGLQIYGFFATMSGLITLLGTSYDLGNYPLSIEGYLMSIVGCFFFFTGLIAALNSGSVER